MQTRQIEGSDSPACSVLVVSCDSHRDLWTPFFTLFNRYWPDCEMPVYLGAGADRMDLNSVCTLNTDESAPWSLRVRILLTAIKTDYVLFLLEDFFLDQTVSASAFEAQLQLLHSLQGVTMRLFPNPPADYFHNGTGVIHRSATYRVSTQAAIWNRRELINLLVDDEDPWEFEWHASQRSQALRSGFYCVRKAVIHYQHVVERGEWFRAPARFYTAQNIGCNLDARPVMGALKTWRKAAAQSARKLGNRARSFWLCFAHPENIPDGG